MLMENLIDEKCVLSQNRLHKSSVSSAQPWICTQCLPTHQRVTQSEFASKFHEQHNRSSKHLVHEFCCLLCSSI